MVQGKYIEPSCSRNLDLKNKFLHITFNGILGFLFLTILPEIAWSAAWLPEKEQYKFSTSYSFVDGPSRKSQKQLAMKVVESYREMGALLSKEKLSKIEKEQLKYLEDFCNIHDSFNDSLFVYQEIEYGINEKQSFGLKAYLSSERFVQYKYNNRFKDDYIFKKRITRGLGFYYKYLLYKNDQWQLTLMPEISEFGRSLADEKFSYGTGIYVGYSKKTKSGKNYFSEFGFSISNVFNDSYKDTILKKISLNEGIEIIKDLVLSNYMEYSFASNGNILYSHTIYEQASIAKEFKSTRNKFSLTAQIGYYWKKSLKNKHFLVSGPLFSLYVNI